MEEVSTANIMFTHYTNSSNIKSMTTKFGQEEVLFHQNKAREHMYVVAMAKYNELGYKSLPHSP